MNPDNQSVTSKQSKAKPSLLQNIYNTLTGNTVNEVVEELDTSMVSGLVQQMGEEAENVIPESILNNNPPNQVVGVAEEVKRDVDMSNNQRPDFVFDLRSPFAITEENKKKRKFEAAFIRDEKKDMRNTLANFEVTEHYRAIENAKNAYNFKKFQAKISDQNWDKVKERIFEENVKERPFYETQKLENRVISFKKIFNETVLRGRFVKDFKFFPQYIVSQKQYLRAYAMFFLGPIFSRVGTINKINFRMTFKSDNAFSVSQYALKSKASLNNPETPAFYPDVVLKIENEVYYEVTPFAKKIVTVKFDAFKDDDGEFIAFVYSKYSGDANFIIFRKPDFERFQRSNLDVAKIKGEWVFFDRDTGVLNSAGLTLPIKEDNKYKVIKGIGDDRGYYGDLTLLPSEMTAAVMTIKEDSIYSCVVDIDFSIPLADLLAETTDLENAIKIPLAEHLLNFKTLTKPIVFNFWIHHFAGAVKLNLEQANFFETTKKLYGLLRDMYLKGFQVKKKAYSIDPQLFTFPKIKSLVKSIEEYSYLVSIWNSGVIPYEYLPDLKKLLIYLGANEDSSLYLDTDFRLLETVLKQFIAMIKNKDFEDFKNGLPLLLTDFLPTLYFFPLTPARELSLANFSKPETIEKILSYSGVVAATVDSYNFLTVSDLNDVMTLVRQKKQKIAEDLYDAREALESKTGDLTSIKTAENFIAFEKEKQDLTQVIEKLSEKLSILSEDEHLLGLASRALTTASPKAVKNLIERMSEPFYSAIQMIILKDQIQAANEVAELTNEFERKQRQENKYMTSENMLTKKKKKAVDAILGMKTRSKK